MSDELRTPQTRPAPRSRVSSRPQGALRVPDLNRISGVPAAPAPSAPTQEARRPLVIRWGKHLRGFFDALMSGSSRVPNTPVLDSADFAWTELLREHWHEIRAEAERVAMRQGAAPSLAHVSPDHRQIAAVDMWRSFFLWGYGYRIEDNLAQCPVTASVVAQIPRLNSAFFSILAPGTHIPDHRGVTKALITCHLGLVVPQDGDVRMRVDRQVVRWAEGETLVFDDTYSHEVWNDSAATRVVLLIQFRRPLRQPGKWLADTFLSLIRRSAFVQEARDNVLEWNAAMQQLDA